jgi:hypothetical protein
MIRQRAGAYAGLTWAGARVSTDAKFCRLLFRPRRYGCSRAEFRYCRRSQPARRGGVGNDPGWPATAEEFWRGRAEPLLSGRPTVIVLLAYAAVLLAQIPATSLMPFLDRGSLMSGLSFALVAFGTLLFTVVMSFLLLNMTKERTELQHKINSLVDPLSGVANRRAFLDGAIAAFAQQAIDHEPLAVILFDLDRFKDINDRLGRFIQDSAADVRCAPGDVGPIFCSAGGGEEFAAILPVGDREAAGSPPRAAKLH